MLSQPGTSDTGRGDQRRRRFFATRLQPQSLKPRKLLLSVPAPLGQPEILHHGKISSVAEDTEVRRERPMSAVHEAPAVSPSADGAHVVS